MTHYHFVAAARPLHPVEEPLDEVLRERVRKLRRTGQGDRLLSSEAPRLPAGSGAQSHRRYQIRNPRGRGVH